MENLNNFWPVMAHLGSASNMGGMFIEFGKAISEVIMVD